MKSHRQRLGASIYIVAEKKKKKKKERQHELGPRTLERCRHVQGRTWDGFEHGHGHGMNMNMNIDICCENRNGKRGGKMLSKEEKCEHVNRTIMFSGYSCETKVFSLLVAEMGVMMRSR